MKEEEIQSIMDEVNEWTVEDLRELADQLLTFADAIESDKGD